MHHITEQELEEVDKEDEEDDQYELNTQQNDKQNTNAVYQWITGDSRYYDTAGIWTKHQTNQIIDIADVGKPYKFHQGYWKRIISKYSSNITRVYWVLVNTDCNYHSSQHGLESPGMISSVG